MLLPRRFETCHRKSKIRSFTWASYSRNWQFSNCQYWCNISAAGSQEP